MGGTNSGWHGGNGRPQRKTRVDECRCVLTVEELERRWPIGDGDIDGWLDNGIRYELRPVRHADEPKASEAVLTLYGLRNNHEPLTNRTERLMLTARPVPFGPDRWHFLCPRCRRPARKLYIPPNGAPPTDRASAERPGRFACRTCHNLTYASVQTHDPRISRLRQDPARLVAILDSARFIDAPTNSVLLALQLFIE